MHKKFFDPPASGFRQAPSSQFIGRGVTLVMSAACSFVDANIYYNQPSRQEGHQMRPQAWTWRRRYLLDRPASRRSGRDFQSPSPSILLAT
jgi:hypothetical protein